MERFSLGGNWQLVDEKDHLVYEAQVPGTVLGTLVECGAIPDPYVGMQEYAVRDYLDRPFTYKGSFTLGEDFLSYGEIHLVCEGLDTLARVEINGKEVLSAQNMHITYREPVKQVLKVGENEIAVHFASTQEFIRGYHYAPEKEIHTVVTGCMEGNQLLRKCHSSFGWDWGPQLPDVGIFRDIYLEGFTGQRISEVELRQSLTETKAILTTRVVLEGEAGSEPSAVRVGLYGPDGKMVAQDFTPISQGQESVSITLEVEDYERWWPAMYGTPACYRAVITLENATAQPRQTIEKTVGFRTLTVSREADTYGREFCFVINGVKIFAMGADWIPEDAILPRVSEERINALLDDALRANMNCLRVWGGGYYPGDAFYEMCDRKGILIWQDLMFACNVYDCTDAFLASCLEEIRDNVVRIRNHPCLALLCGNNELETGWVYWEQFLKETPYLKADYIKMFEHEFPRLVRSLAPDTFYWPSSPSSGGCFADPGAEDDGDAHYWDVWHGLKPFTDYQNHYFRFTSEFGFQSFPCLETVKTYAEPSDWNIFSPVMESHQKNPGANGKILYYLSETFRYPSRFDDLVYLSQIMQGMAMRFGVDHFRRNRGRCMGALYWQLNDNWPVASWASLDYYGRWKALHYMAARFFAPLTGSILVEKEEASLYIENETLTDQEVEVRFSLRNMYCETLVSAKEGGRVTVPALTSMKVLSIPLPKGRGTYPVPQELRSCYLEAKVRTAQGKVLRFSEPLAAFKQLSLVKADIHTEVVQEGENYKITVASPVYAPFVELAVEGADAVFSDNYFDLTDGEPVEILLSKEDLKGASLTANELAQRLHLRSLGDTYLEG